MLLWLDAVICTAVEVARDRKGQPEGDKAMVFLDLLTEERLVVLAMLADAGDEAMALTRYLDRESFETELLTDEIARFLERIRWSSKTILLYTILYIYVHVTMYVCMYVCM